MKKQVILIPYWVEDILKRKEFSIKDAINYDVVLSNLSKEDLAQYFALGNFDKRIFGGEYYSCLPEALLASTADKSKYSKIYDEVYTYSQDDSIKKGLVDRLFNSNNKTNTYESPFRVVDLTTEYCGVIIYPGYFIQDSNTELQKAVLEEILKVLYVYGATHEVASTTFFQSYLKLVSLDINFG